MKAEADDPVRMTTAQLKYGDHVKIDKHDVAQIWLKYAKVNEPEIAHERKIFATPRGSSEDELQQLYDPDYETDGALMAQFGIDGFGSFNADNEEEFEDLIGFGECRGKKRKHYMTLYPSPATPPGSVWRRHIGKQRVYNFVHADSHMFNKAFYRQAADGTIDDGLYWAMGAVNEYQVRDVQPVNSNLL